MSVFLTVICTGQEGSRVVQREGGREGGKVKRKVKVRGMEGGRERGRRGKVPISKTVTYRFCPLPYAVVICLYRFLSRLL